MKNTLLCFAAIFLSFVLQAQYYFNDLIGARETARLMKTYRDNKVRTVSAAGYDANNVKATDFLEFHEVKDNGTTLKITNRNSSSHSVVQHRFDNTGRLITTTDSTGLQRSTIRYHYDPQGQISKIENTTVDNSNEFNLTEIHHWTYNADGKPEKMWRVLSGTDNPKPDSLEIRFISDDMGNTGDEITYRKSVETGRIYYYYDDKGRITDIVRFNAKMKKLLPDVMFEYDDNDRIIQKITTTSSLTLGYFIWRYLFDQTGLKTKEALFNNDKQLTGKIEYSYTYGS